MAGGLICLAVLGLALFVAPFASAQTTDPSTPTDPTTTQPPPTDPPTTQPPQTDPPTTQPPQTDPPTTTTPPFTFPRHRHPRDTTTTAPPPTTRKPVVTTKPKSVTTTKPKSATATTKAASSSKTGVVPFAGTGSATTTTSKKKKGATGATAGAAAATADGQGAVADPALPPATDPILQLAGNDVTRHLDSQKLLSAKGLTEGDSGIGSVLLIGAAAILPIAGAIAFGLFGDGRRWLRRLASRRYD